MVTKDKVNIVRLQDDYILCTLYNVHSNTFLLYIKIALYSVYCTLYNEYCIKGDVQLNVIVVGWFNFTTTIKGKPSEFRLLDRHHVKLYIEHSVANAEI